MRTLFPVGLMAAILCLWLAGPATARADDVQVAAAISDDSPDVGESVDYTITVNGAAQAGVPQNINVDGLTITYEGPSSQTQIIWNSGMSGPNRQSSVIHTYSVVPQRSGDFTIPAQQVQVDGKTYTTQAVNFKVGGGSAGCRQWRRSRQRRGPERRREVVLRRVCPPAQHRLHRRGPPHRDPPLRRCPRPRAIGGSP
jgi:hypothetical protein